MAVYDDEGKTGPEADELNRLTGKDAATQNGLRRSTGRDPGSNDQLQRSTGNSADSANQLRQSTGNDNASRAESFRQAGDEEKASLFDNKSEGDADYPYVQERPRGLSKLKSNFSNSPKRKKTALLAATLGVCGLLVGIIAMILFISTLLIPNLAQNIVAYQSVRISRQYAKTQADVVDEQLAAAAAPDAVETGLQARLKAAGTKSYATWNNVMNKFSIKRGTQLAIQNLAENNSFKITVKRSLLGNEKVLGVTLDNTTYLPVRQGLTRFVPGLKTVFQFKNDVTFSQNFAPALDDALRANENIGPIIRWFVAYNIRKELGIGLFAWQVGKYQGKDAQQARVQEDEDKAAAIDQNPPADDAVTDVIKQADSAGQAAEQQALTSPAQIQAAINNGGILPSVKTAIGNVLAKSGIKSVVNFVNPWYAVFVYLCTIFDGSLDRSGPTIDNQTAQQQRACYYVEAAADQQKTGNIGKGDIAPAVQATAQDLSSDNLATANPLERASGLPVNTTNTPPAEASADGEYTLLNTTIGSTGIPGSTLITNLINRAATRICPTLTNLYLAIGAAAAQIIVTFFTGGTSEAAGEAAGTAAKEVIQAEANNILTKFIVKIGATKILANRVVKFLGKTAISVGSLAAITIVAHEIVLARAGQVDSGFAQGNDLANEADAGCNAHFSEISQQGLYGRPMTKTEVNQSDVENSNYTSYLTSQQGTFQRYFALTNSNSLLTKISMSLYGDMYGKRIFNVFYGMVARMFNPMKLAADIVAPFSNKPAMAAASANTNDDALDYGNVQFGMSPHEETLESEDAYQQFQNQMILDATGQENAVAQKYGTCFTSQVGDLLSSGDIVRDANGNVIANQGLCSPDNLGEDNPNFCYSVNVVDLTTITSQNPNGTIKNYSGCDLVFRWRLAQAYNNSLTNLSQEANPTAVSATQ